MRALYAVFMVVGALGWGSLGWYATGQPGYAAAPPIAGFAVKIDVEGGHGSGVHIGNGYILTAAHVVEDKEPTVITDAGETLTAEVLWVNKTYDVALLRVDGSRLESRELSCAPLKVGTRYVAYGNPMKLDFVHSSGEVVGAAEKRGPWGSAVVVDGTVVQGMSGGGLIADSRVVGIAVGVATVPMGFAPSLTGFGFVVPGSAICGLLGRS